MVGPELPLHVRLHEILKVSDLIYDRCDPSGSGKDSARQRMATDLQQLSGRIDGLNVWVSVSAGREGRDKEILFLLDCGNMKQ